MGNCKSTVAAAAAAATTQQKLEKSGSQNSFTSLSVTSYDNEITIEQDPVALIRRNIIGGSQKIITPFGYRQIVYADYTASGRYLEMIETFLSSNVYPFYANTHTESNATGAITTQLREEARQIVSRSLNAPQDKYVVLFVGTGCTGAIEKMMKVLGIYLPESVLEKWNLSNLVQEEDRPVVFIGPFEHHSNELPWRDSIATVVVIPEDQDGCPDMTVLEEKLNLYKDRNFKIGSFSAGSNVTGICIDTQRYAKLLHKVRTNRIGLCNFVFPCCRDRKLISLSLVIVFASTTPWPFLTLREAARTWTLI